MIAGFWDQDEPHTDPLQNVYPQEVKVLCCSPRFSSRSPIMLEVFVSCVREHVCGIAVKTGASKGRHYIYRCYMKLDRVVGADVSSLPATDVSARVWSL